MTSDKPQRPSRELLQRRLRVLKRAVVILAAGSFAAIAALAAGATTTRSQTSTPAKQTIPSTPRDNQQDQSGSFWFNPDDGSGSSGSLGSGSNAAPPAAGTHAS